MKNFKKRQEIQLIQTQEQLSQRQVQLSQRWLQLTQRWVSCIFEKKLQNRAKTRKM